MVVNSDDREVAMTARNTVPRSRISLTYDTRQPDQARKEKELPLRLLVMGDLTGRANKPDGQAGQEPFENRKIHNLNGGNLDTVISKLGITVELDNIPNHVTRDGTPFRIVLPISSMASFEPGEVVHHIEPAQQLLKIRKLLLELQAQVDNNKEFRRLLRELTAPGNEQLRKELQDAFDKADARFAQLQIPTPTQLEVGTPDPKLLSEPSPTAGSTPSTPASASSPPATATPTTPVKPDGAAS
jgi:type VI secretion system protein ImpB